MARAGLAAVLTVVGVVPLVVLTDRPSAPLEARPAPQAATELVMVGQQDPTSAEPIERPFLAAATPAPVETVTGTAPLPGSLGTLLGSGEAQGQTAGTTAAGVGGRTAPGVASTLADAYLAAARSAPASCRMPVSLLAAIGEVESSSIRGRSITPDHRVEPGVFGPALNGNGFASIPDTDGGALDGDTVWDRAVGPMQFIPSTWRSYGVDGDGDGRADPQNVYDATASAARYLCAGGRDLATDAGLRSAILSYNYSQEYLANVLSWKAAFESGGANLAVGPELPVTMGPPTGPTSVPTLPPEQLPPVAPLPEGELIAAVDPQQPDPVGTLVPPEPTTTPATTPSTTPTTDPATVPPASTPSTTPTTDPATVPPASTPSTTPATDPTTTPPASTPSTTPTTDPTTTPPSEPPAPAPSEPPAPAPSEPPAPAPSEPPAPAPSQPPAPAPSEPPAPAPSEPPAPAPTETAPPPVTSCTPASEDPATPPASGEAPPPASDEAPPVEVCP